MKLSFFVVFFRFCGSLINSRSSLPFFSRSFNLFGRYFFWCGSSGSVSSTLFAHSFFSGKFFSFFFILGLRKTYFLMVNGISFVVHPFVELCFRLLFS